MTKTCINPLRASPCDLLHPRARSARGLGEVFFFFFFFYFDKTVDRLCRWLKALKKTEQKKKKKKKKKEKNRFPVPVRGEVKKAHSQCAKNMSGRMLTERPSSQHLLQSCGKERDM